MPPVFKARTLHTAGDRGPPHSRASAPAVLPLHFNHAGSAVLKTPSRASLVVQGLETHQPMQETGFPALAQEVPTCSGATDPERPRSHGRCAQSRAPHRGEPLRRRGARLSQKPSCKRTRGSGLHVRGSPGLDILMLLH